MIPNQNRLKECSILTGRKTTDCVSVSKPKLCSRKLNCFVYSEKESSSESSSVTASYIQKERTETGRELEHDCFLYSERTANWNSRSGSWAGPNNGRGVCGSSLATDQVGVKHPPLLPLRTESLFYRRPNIGWSVHIAQRAFRSAAHESLQPTRRDRTEQATR
jgi:hypothetical protein